jgi:D-alanyl-D-alanine carboxypeptidase
MMKKNILYILLVFSLLLAGCASSQNNPTVEPTIAAPEPTSSPAPTLALIPTVEEPAAVPPPEDDLVMLRSTPWQWVSFTNPVEQFTIDNPQNYVVTFNNDATLNATADCNNANGSYTTDSSSITVVMGPMTMAACPEGSHSDDFIKYLSSAAIYFFKDRHLYIDLFVDGGTMEFTPVQTGQAGETAISANAWTWERFTDPTQQFDVPQPDHYIVNLLEQGNLVVVVADCNIVQGTFSTEGQSLKIELGPSTLAECPPGSLSQDFIKFIQSAAIYNISDGELTIDLAADGGTMVFGVNDPLAEQQKKLKVSTWDEALEKALTSPYCDAPGAILLVDTPQGRFLKAEGLASTQDQTSMQPMDTWEIGSNTKSFTTVLGLQLQEEGVWSLDDPLDKWLPEWAVKIPNGDQITLRMLGQNHTGIPDYADIVIGKAISGDSLDEASLEKGFTPGELVDFALTIEPKFAPGEGWEYSTTNFILLAMAIEKATGKTIDQLYQERIFAPLEMDHTYLLDGVPDKGAIIPGYWSLENGEVVDVTNWNGSQGWSGGGIVSTAEDMAKYVEALAKGTLFKDPASLKQMTDFGDGAVASFSGYGQGVGIWSAEPFAWGHAGQTPGFQSLFTIYPEQDARVVFLANSGTCHVSMDSIMDIIKASPDLFN